MQNVVVADVLVRIEMEPALAAFVLRPAVPGNRQSLQSSIGKFDQVLLKRIHAECVFHLDTLPACRQVRRSRQKFPVLAKEPGLDLEILKTCIVKITEHRLVRRMSHCALMLGRVPKLVFDLMAAGANLTPGKRCLARRCRRAGTVGEQLPGHNTSSREQDDDGQRTQNRLSGNHFKMPAIAFHA